MHSIRLCTESDARALSSLAASTFYETYSRITPESKEIYEAYVQDIFSVEKTVEEIKKTNVFFYFILDQSNSPVGYAKIEKDLRRTTLILEKLYIRATHQSQGAGLELYHYLKNLSTAEGYKLIRLGVYDQNHKAISFYEKLGFVKTGERDFIYIHRGLRYQDKDWIMELKI